MVSPVILKVFSCKIHLKGTGRGYPLGPFGNTIAGGFLEPLLYYSYLGL